MTNSHENSMVAGNPEDDNPNKQWASSLMPAGETTQYIEGDPHAKYDFAHRQDEDSLIPLGQITKELFPMDPIRLQKLREAREDANAAHDKHGTDS